MAHSETARLRAIVARLEALSAQLDAVIAERDEEIIRLARRDRDLQDDSARLGQGVLAAEAHIGRDWLRQIERRAGLGPRPRGGSGARGGDAVNELSNAA